MSLEAIVPLSLKLPLTILHPCGHHHLERKLSSKLLMSARISVLSNWLVTSSQKCLSLVYRLLSYTYPVRVWCATPSFANQADTQLKKKKQKKAKVTNTNRSRNRHIRTGTKRESACRECVCFYGILGLYLLLS